MAAPRVSPKVKAATAGAGAAGVVGAFVLWLLDNFVMTPGVEDGVPGPVSAFALLVISAGITYAAGYNKPDDRSPEIGPNAQDWTD